jgi:hypothetical protein
MSSSTSSHVSFDWIKLANGNSTWTNTHVEERITSPIPLRCTVYLKRGTKTSWRWIINHNASFTYHSPYTHTSRNKAQQDAEQVLALMAQNISYLDATN